MSTRRIGKILPPNSTSLELDLLQAGNRFPLLLESVPSITRAKLVELPDSFLPWLIEEYGLEPFVQFFGGDQRRAIREGIPLIRKIGTPYAVKALLSLGGFPGSELEEEPAGLAHWSEFQVALKTVPQGLSEIATAEAAVALGKPLSRRLARMYCGLDVRPMMLDESVWEDALLDDYSGIRLDPAGPVLSFGEWFDYIAGLPSGHPYAGSRYAQSMCILAFYNDVFRLDQGILDDEGTELNTDINIGVIAGFSAESDRPSTHTPDVQTICKAMVVADDQQLFGTLNMTFARSQVVEEGALMMLDDGIFEETGINSYEVPILELVENIIARIVPTGTHVPLFSGQNQTPLSAAMYDHSMFRADRAGAQSCDLGRIVYASPDGHPAWASHPWPMVAWRDYLLPIVDFADTTNRPAPLRSARSADMGTAFYRDIPGVRAWPHFPWLPEGWAAYTAPSVDFAASSTPRPSATAGTLRATTDGSSRVTTDGRTRDCS